MCCFYTPFRNGFREVIWQDEEAGSSPVVELSQCRQEKRRQWPGCCCWYGGSLTRGGPAAGGRGAVRWASPHCLCSGAAAEFRLSPGCTAVEVVSCYFSVHL